jgi:hypothetical protein
VLTGPRLREGDLVELSGRERPFDAILVAATSVLRDGAGWRAWYTAWGGDERSLGAGRVEQVHFRIGQATSPDGLVWTKRPGAAEQGAAVGLGADGGVDAVSVGHPSVVKAGTTYHLWYEAYDGRTWRIAHARSTDGSAWQKDGVALEPGAAGALDALGVRHPVVRPTAAGYELWYQGRSASRPAFHVLRARSPTASRGRRSRPRSQLHPDPPPKDDERIHVGSLLPRPDGSPARVLRERDGGDARGDVGPARGPPHRDLQRDGPALRAGTRGTALAAVLLAAAALATTRATGGASAPPLAWASKSRYRLLLDVDPRGVRRSHSVAAVDADFAAELRQRGAAGAFDESTLDVVAYDRAGQPRPYDASRAPDERVLIPWRLDRFYPLDRVTLSFVVPDAETTRFAVYFDTADRARAPRYPGLVGDGDLFTLGWGRREIAANASDTFVDLDGDGDLDLVKGGTEPFLYVYENRGRGRFVDRGRLTSGGEVLMFPRDDANRSWVSAEFADWDGDGDPDLFASFRAGPYENRVVRYENVTTKGGPLTFLDRGPITTVSGVPLTGRVSFVDWDGDGRLDVLTDADDTVTFHRNVGTSPRSGTWPSPTASGWKRTAPPSASGTPAWTPRTSTATATSTSSRARRTAASISSGTWARAPRPSWRAGASSPITTTWTRRRA